MHVHILGICGTFMGGVAALAREAGHKVTGSDANVYPPMSTQLQAMGIALTEGYDPAQFDPAPDMVVVGNVISRGNPAIEHVLNAGLPYTSGPQWLAEHVLAGRHVLAVAGTHGKTTTSSLLAWLLEAAGLEPGFLIGGVPLNFGVSAQIGGGKYFVVEADEYDTAFFDKRSKFVHYQPRTLILNNLEFDHADIFDDLAAIERQFHHLIRTVPGQGRILVNAQDQNLARVLARGCWSEQQAFNDEAGWSLQRRGEEWRLLLMGDDAGVLAMPLPGAHNRSNALAAIAAAAHVGVTPEQSLAAINRFESVRRRLEFLGEVRGVKVYDDFAHHPTAIAETLAAIRERHAGRVLAVLEPASNTMRLGVHGDALAASLAGADEVFLRAREDLKWSAEQALAGLQQPMFAAAAVDELVAAVIRQAAPGDCVLVMSNGGFDGIHGKLLAGLEAPAN